MTYFSLGNAIHTQHRLAHDNWPTLPVRMHVLQWALYHVHVTVLLFLSFFHCSIFFLQRFLVHLSLPNFCSPYSNGWYRICKYHASLRFTITVIHGYGDIYHKAWFRTWSFLAHFSIFFVLYLVPSYSPNTFSHRMQTTRCISQT